MIAGSSSSTKPVATKLDSKIISAIQCLDDRQICGEFKVWIWKNYLAHSLCFMLMVDPVKESVLVKRSRRLQIKYIKRWLNLPRCCTLATIFYPDVLRGTIQAKMSMVTATEMSKKTNTFKNAYPCYLIQASYQGTRFPRMLCLC